MLGVAHDVHALAAPAESGLHDERESDPGGLFLRLGKVHGLAGPRDDRHPGRVRDPARGGLVAHRLDRARRGADEGEAGVLDRLRELRSLREEPVAGVDQGGPRLGGGLHDPVDREVGRGCERGTDPEGLVRHLDVESIAIGVGVDGDRGDAQVATRPGDPDGDLAAVGDQELLLPRHVAPRYSVGRGGTVLSEDALHRALEAVGLTHRSVGTR